MKRRAEAFYRVGSDGGCCSSHENIRGPEAVERLMIRLINPRQ
jgi:hypothetical protein